ncbi:hypothetical protein VH22019_00044 [Vibrio phage VH2_2019]|nr:hypothetical protein VH22019_00044 [Vibrio phage VH2_2019]
MRIVIYPETQTEFRALAKPRLTPNQTVVGQLTQVKAFRGFQLEVDIHAPEAKDPKELLRDKLADMVIASRENGYPVHASAIEECLDHLISDGLAAPYK